MEVSNICGLNNIGNTCFMNAALQLIVNCTVLTKFILNNNFKSDKINFYKQFLKDYFSNKIITPNTVKVIVSNKNSIFSGFGQQDAHEFLVFLIDLINEEFKKENEIEPKNVLGIPMDNLINIIFNTNLISVIKCNDIKSKTKVSENILSLPISNVKTTFENCLNEFCSVEKLEGDNKWYNENDKKFYDANKTLVIKSLPKYLIIHLKRFTFNKISSKNNANVEMDLKINLKNDVFKLRGFILHMGSVNGGHYISFILKDNRWFLCNDSNVNEVRNISDYINKGYIYLYVKDKK